MAITNLPTKLTSVGNQGSASDYSSTSDASVFQFDYQDLDYTPKTTDDYKNDFEEELQVFINGIRIYRTDTDTGIDDGLTTNQKSRLTTLTSSTFPWDIETSTKKVQINKTHASYGDSDPNNPGYPALATWTIIKVIRIKPDKSTLATDFQSASVLTEAELDNAFSETFHVAQESIDTAQDSMTLGTDNIWDADNKNIKNIATPSGSDPSHYAVNKGYVDGSSTTVTVANNIDNVNTVAGQISPTNNLLTVAGSVTAGHIATVAGDANDIGAVAGKEAEIGRLGHADYSSGADAYLAKLGADAFSNASTGYIKKVADIDANVTKVANIDSNVTTVATLGTNGADVTTVAGKSTEIDVLVNKFDGSTSLTSGTFRNITQVDTVADAIANVNTVATANSNITTITTGDNLTNIETCADNIGSLNTVATNAESNAIVMGIALG